MVAPATLGGTGATGAPSTTKDAPIALVPFVRASQEHREPVGMDVSRLQTASDQDLGVHDIPAYGYMRSLTLLVQGTGAVDATDAVFAEDGPFNALKNISLAEPNGATIVQFNSGYDLYLAHKYGGYRFSNDPKCSPVYSADLDGNFSFLLRIPVEICQRDGLGSLPNQNAAATFKLRATLAASGDLYSTIPDTTLPTVRVRAYLEAWDQPEVSSGGQGNQTVPPAMNTTQYWSTTSYAVSAGEFNVRLSRMGNYIRNLIFVYTRTASTRANGDADFPVEARLEWDTRPLDIIERNNWRNQTYERYGYLGRLNGTNIAPTAVAADAPGGRDAGVYPYDFCHEFDGKVGNENRDGWLPTLASTRLELRGNFTTAGTLKVLTNDVSVAGQVFL